MQASPAPAIECEIRAEPETNGLRIAALVRAAAPVSGQYRLQVVKQSASGRSSNTQSGAFAIEPGHEQLLTTVVLDRSAIGHYRAELSLQSDQETSSCTSP